MTDSNRIGFIGLGTMGRPMAAHLLGGGRRLFAHSRTGIPEELITAGAIACTSAGDVTTRADIVFVMVPDTSDVEAVLFGRDGVAESLSPGKSSST